MELATLKNSGLSQTISRQALKVRKNSPHIMFGAGIVGMVGTVVLASKATLKLEEAIEETEDLKAKAHFARDTKPEDYSEQDLKKDLTIVHARQVGKIVKLYSPAAAVGVASIGLLTGAHVTMNRRNAGLMAAYVTVDKSFREYRERVAKAVGVDKEREFRFGTDKLEKVVEDDKGKKTEKKVKVAEGTSEYGKFFDSSNPNWTYTRENSLFFLKMQQQYFNNQLQARGHVFLNEVYDALGLDRTSAGAVVGWVRGNGDDFIDFGIYDDDKADRFLDFMAHREDCLVLDFNVDGVIYDLI